MLHHRKFISFLSATILLTIILLWTSVYSNGQEITPPIAEVIPHADTLHGDIRIDNYRWLHDKSNPEVIEYLEAENRYTEAMMKNTEKLQKKLYEEMVGRIKETDMEVPEKIDDYYYYTRTEEGKQYRIHCRKKGSLDAEEEIILDENELAEGHDYFGIYTVETSPDHRFMVFSVDTTGSGICTLYIKDLNNGELLEDEISNAYYPVVWANDNKTIFYIAWDEDKKHPCKLYRHILGTTQKEDKMVYHEKDEAFSISIHKIKVKNI